MMFSSHGSIESDGTFDRSDFGCIPTHVPSRTSTDDIYILRDKLHIPEDASHIERPRLTSLLMKSVNQFPVTLISGRAGTGKTALAANFAGSFKKVCWYSIESTDTSWRVFSRYFSASLPGKPVSSPAEDLNENSLGRPAIAEFLVTNLTRLHGRSGQGSLFILDDVHHIFDALWFDDFLNLLVYSLPAETHLLLLCRSKPPNPLWRLRSKQMLNMIDEKVIAFNLGETEALFDSIRFPRSRAKEAHGRSYGRISKLLQFAESQDLNVTA